MLEYEPSRSKYTDACEGTHMHLPANAAIAGIDLAGGQRLMEELDVEMLAAALEDTQASLAAALARIEAFRLREKKLMAELTKLRTTVHSAPDGEGTPGPGPSSERQCHNKQAWPTSSHVYVTQCKGEHPIFIITSSGNKVPGSLVVTPEFIDFVEVKARIRQEDFVGITTLKGVKPSSQKQGPFLSPSQSLQRLSVGSIGDAAGSGSKQPAADSQPGVWQMLWKTEDVPHRLAFEAASDVREALHQHTERWMGIETPSPAGPGPAADLAACQSTSENGSGPALPGGVPSSSEDNDLQVPRHLQVGQEQLSLVGEPSCILSSEHCRAVAGAVPAMERMREWGLAYSMARHGISLHTLYRKMVAGMPTIMVIKDSAGYVFGCYTPDSWRISPRFYGNGQTCVFQLEPHRVQYPWTSLSRTKNDFFQYATPDCAAVGGLRHFAIWIDSELLNGSSGQCGTFGSPCLAHKEDFRIAALEVWQAQS